MAGRVPQGADGAAMRGEMEAVFLENLKHAAGVLAQVRQQKNDTLTLAVQWRCPSAKLTQVQTLASALVSGTHEGRGQ